MTAALAILTRAVECAAMTGAGYAAIQIAVTLWHVWPMLGGQP